MEEMILVHVKRNDKVEDIRSYVEKLAALGRHITFLVPYPLEPWRTWLQDYWITADDRRKAQSKGREINEKYSWDAQKMMADQMLSPCREALKQKGVETSVNLYSGDLERALKEYHHDGACLLLAIPENDRFSARACWSLDRRTLALQS